MLSEWNSFLCRGLTVLLGSRAGDKGGVGLLSGQLYAAYVFMPVYFFPQKYLFIYSGSAGPWFRHSGSSLWHSARGIQLPVRACSVAVVVSDSLQPYGLWLSTPTAVHKSPTPYSTWREKRTLFLPKSKARNCPSLSIILVALSSILTSKYLVIVLTPVLIFNCGINIIHHQKQQDFIKFFSSHD